MARYQAHKLERWGWCCSRSLTLSGACPVKTVCGNDLLSRWDTAQAQVSTKSVRCLLAMTQQVVMKRGETPPTGVAWNEDKNLFLDKEDRIWIPPSATDLQQRHPRSRCQDQACIHCLSIYGSVVPHPLGSALHAEKPQELNQFDWLSMPTATNRWQKILAIKDDMSGIVQLWPCETSDAATTSNGLLNWFMTFGYLEVCQHRDQEGHRLRLAQLHVQEAHVRAASQSGCDKRQEKLAIGDFVHVGQVSRQGNKLSLHCGRDVTEELVDHNAFDNEGFRVAKLGDVRE
ncbi:hypothetical protein H257_19017 [Aphanomyces astaci]|uniref:Uncharacterized protein n=1 Tax=Aphanomyces astaci TaxID=112090 RepID=W4FB65_APHAT|nr:hypothetical protein H257_19017 [Aphanomyces astaci]ETV64041.1 hypothetical protein H257_19017 [Aphanomyces astaci]|eukprot:XP_009846475.1 hypothetical protein H257_19017 [Aphanomyces astaci]